MRLEYKRRTSDARACDAGASMGSVGAEGAPTPQGNKGVGRAPAATGDARAMWAEAEVASAAHAMAATRSPSYARAGEIVLPVGALYSAGRVAAVLHRLKRCQGAAAYGAVVVVAVAAKVVKVVLRGICHLDDNHRPVEEELRKNYDYIRATSTSGSVGEPSLYPNPPDSQYMWYRIVIVMLASQRCTPVLCNTCLRMCLHNKRCGCAPCVSQ